MKPECHIVSTFTYKQKTLPISIKNFVAGVYVYKQWLIEF